MTSRPCIKTNVLGVSEIVPKLDLPRRISEKRSIAWSRQTVTQATT